jgi:hypothetical protein
MVDHAAHDKQHRDNGGDAFPLEPEDRRRPDDGKDHGDKEGHEDRLDLIDTPNDDHERCRDDEDTRSAI